MQAHTYTPVGTALAVVTLIINLFCSSSALAQNTTKTTSKAYCLPAVLECVTQAFPPGGGDVSANPEQIQWFKTYAPSSTPEWLSALHAAGVLEGMAGTVAEVNQWLVSKGFNFNLHGVKAAAAVFDLKLEWSVPGHPGKLIADGQAFITAVMPASSFENSFSSSKHDKPVFKLKPKNAEWEIFVTEFSGDVAKEEELVSRASDLLEDLSPSDVLLNWPAVSIPKVSFEKSVDVSILQGMASSKFRVDQAVKAIKFKLSELGMEASAAVAFTTRGAGPTAYPIASRFMVVARLKGHKTPAFVTLCDKDSWVKKDK